MRTLVSIQSSPIPSLLAAPPSLMPPPKPPHTQPSSPQLAEKEKALQQLEQRHAQPSTGQQQQQLAARRTSCSSGSGSAGGAMEGDVGAQLQHLQQRVQDLEKDLAEQKNATIGEEKAKKQALTAVRDTQVGGRASGGLWFPVVWGCSGAWVGFRFWGFRVCPKP